MKPKDPHPHIQLVRDKPSGPEIFPIEPSENFWRYTGARFEGHVTNFHVIEILVGLAFASYDYERNEVQWLRRPLYFHEFNALISLPAEIKY